MLRIMSSVGRRWTLSMSILPISLLLYTYEAQSYIDTYIYIDIDIYVY